jgi:NAD(P)-dependent dehydrogenase (short-subunit alcohol dehydrogenase family)
MASKAEFNVQTEAREVISAFPEAIRDKTSRLISSHLNSSHTAPSPSTSTARLNKSLVLITGVGPNGLGAAIAHELAVQSPALLILTGRDSVKVETIITELTTASPTVKTRALIFDISSFVSINAAAGEVLAYPEPGIDIIINNAGVMNIPTRTLSTDGFEMQLAVNYLGAFLFTNSIMPKLLASSAARTANIITMGTHCRPSVSKTTTLKIRAP